MIEAAVVDAFCAHLEADGWTCEREVKTPTGPVDVVATRAGERIIAEAKGHTAAIGLDVNTLYGQLLNRMTDPGARYAVVVPASVLASATRVPARVRNLLNIDVYLVADDATLTKVEAD